MYGESAASRIEAKNKCSESDFRFVNREISASGESFRTVAIVSGRESIGSKCEIGRKLRRSVGPLVRVQYVVKRVNFGKRILIGGVGGFRAARSRRCAIYFKENIRK